MAHKSCSVDVMSCRLDVLAVRSSDGVIIGRLSSHPRVRQQDVRQTLHRGMLTALAAIRARLQQAY
jgi:hypothetical protein